MQAHGPPGAAAPLIYGRMRSVFKLLGIEPDPASVRDPGTVERIARELDHLETDAARHVAAFAYVLARVAHADWEISEDELAVMRRLAEQAVGLPPEHASLVVEIARSRALELGATENYLVTRRFRELSTREQRLGLLECLFAVAAADDDISTAENHEISKIGNELGLTPPEVAQARAAFREHLAVLKDLPTGTSRTR